MTAGQGSNLDSERADMFTPFHLSLSAGTFNNQFFSFSCHQLVLRRLVPVPEVVLNLVPAQTLYLSILSLRGTSRTRYSQIEGLRKNTGKWV